MNQPADKSKIETDQTVDHSGPPLDLSVMSQSVKGKIEILQKLIDYLLATYPERLKDIRSAIEQKESKQLRYHAHTLKGALLNFKAEHAATLSYKLEKMGTESNFATAMNTFHKLEEEMTRVKDFLVDSDWKKSLGKAN